MTHQVHHLPRRIFGDDCEECVERASSIQGLVAGLDAHNKVKLGDLAHELYVLEIGDHNKPADISWADLKAVDQLRMAARLTFATMITMEVAEGG